eukprot:scaffold472882_cov30-Prasinocladus_malaysianus.AAC.1
MDMSILLDGFRITYSLLHDHKYSLKIMRENMCHARSALSHYSIMYSRVFLGSCKGLAECPPSRHRGLDSVSCMPVDDCP